MTGHKIFRASFASVYPHYVARAEKESRSSDEVDEVVRWLTGYVQDELEAQIEKEADFESFFADAPELSPPRELITRVVCGFRVEETEDPLIRVIRYLDKLIDELAKGKSMEKILRQPA